MFTSESFLPGVANQRISYLVTELMATDLHTLLKTKKVDNQFTQYFLYQMMVRPSPHPSRATTYSASSAV